MKRLRLINAIVASGKEAVENADLRAQEPIVEMTLRDQKTCMRQASRQLLQPLLTQKRLREGL